MFPVLGIMGLDAVEVQEKFQAVLILQYDHIDCESRLL